MGIMDEQSKALLNKRLAEIQAREANASELWKHLIITEATILGITVGLLGLSTGDPSPALRGSWAALLVSIVLGFVLAEVAENRAGHDEERLHNLTMDHWVIDRRQETGQFEKNPREYVDLWMAAIVKFRDSRPTSARWMAPLRMSFYATSFVAFVLLLMAVGSSHPKPAARADRGAVVRVTGTQPKGAPAATMTRHR